MKDDSPDALAELRAEFDEHRRNTDAAIGLLRTEVAELRELGAEHDTALERLTEGQPDLLTPAIRRAQGFKHFTAGELWTLAVAEDRAAINNGLPRPELIEAIEGRGITGPHGLGRWLAKKHGQAFEAGGRTNSGTVWTVKR